MSSAHPIAAGSFAIAANGAVMKVVGIRADGKLSVVHSTERHTTRRDDVPFDVDPVSWGLTACVCTFCGAMRTLGA